MKKIWSSTGGVFFGFPFSIGCTINEGLYKSEKITAKQFLKDKILSMPGEYAYFTLCTEGEELLIYISLHNFRINIDKLLDSFDDSFDIFNNDQLIFFQRAEYHWEIVLSKLPEPLKLPGLKNEI